MMHSMANHIPLSPAWWIDLEYMPGWKAALIFLALAAPVVWMGLRSLAGLGPVRRWVAISLRLLVLLALVLIIGGARWKRMHKVVEVMVLRDISESTELVRQYPGKNLKDSIDEYLRGVASDKYKPNRDDRIGVMSFASRPSIDWLPATALELSAHGIREQTNGSDIGSAIQLALATFQRDAMHRILLISDGNQTSGDLENALAAAVAQRIPIDVMKLNYNVQNEVLVERISAPSWKRESDAFDVFVSLISTNPAAVSGRLTLLEEGQRIDQRDVVIDAANINPEGKLEPRKHVERIRVPAAKSRRVRRFTATFDPEVINSRTAVAGANAGAAPGANASKGGSGIAAGTLEPPKPGDTLLQNNRASAFTYVEGQGRVLYADNSKNGAGKILQDALASEGVGVERVAIDQVPEDLISMQEFDAVILNNVPRGRTPLGADGLTDKHDAALASYVHDFGGGLIMVGGPDSFGAGGWQGSKVEEVMPVNFDIPAQRQLPKGALVLIMHSCEMPDGNYWGEQCALKAVETLSAQDEIGVISYNWQGAAKGGVGGSAWDYPLQPKGDGSRLIAAIKRMQLGDMPSFDDSLELALNGNGQPGAPCLKNSNAAQKHVIIISDGDPAQPNPKLVQQYKAAKVTVSTISVYPHGNTVPPTMQNIATQTGGRYYGPIEKNPGQLPQIFIKEATVVRRTLLQERRSPPITVSLMPNASDIMKGVPAPPPVYGLVLSAKKNNPTIEMPLVATMDGKKIDPLFAHWQAGLGKAAAFTSDGSPIWNEPWLDGDYAPSYGKFWAQMVRGVSRPPMSRDFTVATIRNGDKATVTVEAADKEAGFASFLSIRGVVMDPDGKQHEIRLLQTAPGTYTTDFNTPNPGNYVVGLRYTGQDDQSGWLVSGLAVNDSPELRELKSNEMLLEEIAARTGGRVIPAFSPQDADLFSRKNLIPSSSPLPVWDILIPILLALIILDVAVRRIAWDWNSTKKLATAMAGRVRQYTTTRSVETRQTLDALKKVRDDVSETNYGQEQPKKQVETTVATPDRTRKFEARTRVEGDITQVVGGATAKPVPPPPKDPKPKGAPVGASGGHTGSLLEAKRRAQQKIKEKEQGQD